LPTDEETVMTDEHHRQVEHELHRWQTMALAVLRKAGRAGPEHVPGDVDRILAAGTDHGGTIAPLYLSGPPAPALGGPLTPGSWDVRRKYHAGDPGLRQALAADGAAGVTSIWLTTPDAGALAEALPPVLQAGHPVVLDAGEHTTGAAATLIAAADRDPATRDALRGNLGADPIGSALRHGGPADLASIPELIGHCAGRTGLRAVVVDGTAFHDAGGGEADELGAALAAAVAYLRVLTGGGVPVAVALDQIEFRYAAGPDQFLSIAKLRAARLLWARVGTACGVQPTRQRQHAVTSRAMMTASAPLNNLVRTTVAAFAAVTGGADALTVLPYDTAGGDPQEQAQRLALTTQAVLRLEAHAARVHDPAAGSWYVEQLTRDLATAGWDWFQKLESNGGMVASLADGMVAERLAATAQNRELGGLL
jgi:methylmalonyl-CoA mutase